MSKLNEKTETAEDNIAEETGKILVVDNDNLVRTALEMTLQKEGYEVLTASNGKEAVDTMQRVPLGLIICDQVMPGMTGIEVMQKAQELTPDSVRVLLTASQDHNVAIKAINLGHVDQYLTKPWKDAQLRKVVKTSLEKYKLIKENRFLQKLIFSQHKKLARSHENLRYELQCGRQIHEHMLLGKVPKDIPGITIDALSVPSNEIDGDFFEFYRPNPFLLDLVLGDVMGKGIPAALVGTAVKTQLIRFAMPFPYTQIFDKSGGWRFNLLAPQDILSHLHREIANQLIELEYFVTLFYGRFDFQYKTFNFVDCGSAKPIHYKAKEQTLVFLEGTNFPLGMVPDNHYRSVETYFSEGDLFIFFSDGVTEARSPSGEFFGMERIANLVLENQDLKTSALVDLIKQAVTLFTEKSKLNDDLSIIAIKIGQTVVPEWAKTTSAHFYSDFSQLQAVRDFVKRFCLHAPGDNERLTQEMQLVLDEAFCNIVKHGHIEPMKSPIQIQGEMSGQGINITISDKGLPFDPAQIKEPQFSGHQDTGYGWHLIRALSDKVAYTRKESLEGWNHLSIFKHYYLGKENMNVAHKKQGNILIITPEGESLDAKDAPKFKDSVLSLINDHNSKGVVFDLNNLQFIDSSGLGSFLSVLRLLNARGGDLKLSRMNRPIRTMFELVKMHKIFEIFNSTDDAVQSFK